MNPQQQSIDNQLRAARTVSRRRKQPQHAAADTANAERTDDVKSPWASRSWRALPSVQTAARWGNTTR